MNDKKNDLLILEVARKMKDEGGDEEDEGYEDEDEPMVCPHCGETIE